MRDFYDLKNLPVLTPNRITLQASSFDRKYDNADFGQFLYKDKDGAAVMFDDKGAGCIKSIWSAIVTDESILRFYFDGEQSPRYTVSLMGLYAGEIDELRGLGNSLDERGHYDGADCRAGNCFLPIPYEKGLKITATGKLDFYYHIMYEKYTGINDGAKKTGEVTKQYINAYGGNREIETGEKFENSVTLSKMYTDVFKSDKAGVITEFTVEAPSGTDISKIKVDISYDGNLISNVATPLSYLFSQPFGFTEIKSHAIETKTENGKDIMSLYLPIPYWQSVTICFVNTADEPVSLTLKLTVAENDYIKDETGYFCADYREGLTELYSDWLIGEYSGRGNIIGVVQTCHGGQYCEGNEHFYMNGAKTPQINGTGTEDFYLACYWPNLKFDSPCAGCVNDVYLMNDSTVKGSFKYPSGYYRFLHDMPISFINGIKLCIGHGAVEQTYSDYTSLCLSYRRDDVKMEETDFINCGSAASKGLHSYTSNNYKELTLESKIESYRRAPSIKRNGLLHGDGALIEFTAAVQKGNKGVCIRRLYDQSHSPQLAHVYVNGELAGDWYNAGFNDYAAFADNDFYIPEKITSDCETLKIKLEVENKFSDFEYRVYSIL